MSDAMKEAARVREHAKALVFGNVDDAVGWLNSSEENHISATQLRVLEAALRFSVNARHTFKTKLFKARLERWRNIARPMKRVETRISRMGTKGVQS